MSINVYNIIEARVVACEMHLQMHLGNINLKSENLNMAQIGIFVESFKG